MIDDLKLFKCDSLNGNFGLYSIGNLSAEEEISCNFKKQQTWEKVRIIPNTVVSTVTSFVQFPRKRMVRNEIKTELFPRIKVPAPDPQTDIPKIFTY